MQKINLILERFEQVREDFIGIRFESNIFLELLHIFLITFFLFFLYYSIGKRIRRLFFNAQIVQKSFFINVALGYIFIGTCLALLGSFSLLNRTVITGFLVCITIVLVFSFRLTKQFVRKNWTLKKVKKYFKDYSWIKISICAFVFITFLRILPPEIGADALDYHTSFPRLYLKYQTMMLPALGNESYITIPQLGEMSYVLTEFFGVRDASRFIHFGFYILTLLLLCSICSEKENRAFRLAALILITSPLILHIAPSAYSDFPAVFCFLLVLFILTKNKLKTSNIVLSGIFFGGMLATKIWALALFPIFLISLFLILKKDRTKMIALFVLSSLSISLLWYIRSFVLTGDPLHHNQYFMEVSVEKNYLKDVVVSLFQMQRKLRLDLLLDYSPLVFFGFLAWLYKPLKLIRQLKTNTYFLFFIIFSVIYFFLPTYFFDGRYLLVYFTLFSYILSAAITYFANIKVLKYFFTTFVAILFIYYSINSFLLLPYGLGWADREKYLERIMRSYSSAFYDFDKKFSKHIRASETIATYRVSQYYYADFSYKNVYYFFTPQKKRIVDLKRAGLSKLLIRGGDIEWFCKTVPVSDCKSYTFEKLVEDAPAKQYLYRLL